MMSVSTEWIQQRYKSRGSILLWDWKYKSNGILPIYIEKLMREWPVGSHIVMKSPPIFYGGKSLMSIGWKYRSQKSLGFIYMEGSGSTEIVIPYLSCFPETKL